MDWKQQFKFHDLSFRNTCIVLLLLVFNLFVLTRLSFQQANPEAVSAAYSANCASNQRQIYKLMTEFSGEEGFELPPDWTVADLIRAAVRKKRQTSHPFPEKTFICRNIRKERVRTFPYLRHERTEVDAPYLVFSLSASAVFDDSLQQPVPILMCPPGAHGKNGTMVLYSDGSTKKLTAEEAEKLVATQSPYQLLPVETQPESMPDSDGHSSANRQE